jgi:hypothetical protein
MTLSWFLRVFCLFLVAGALKVPSILADENPQYFTNNSFQVHWQVPTGWIKNSHLENGLVGYVLPDLRAEAALKAFPLGAENAWTIGGLVESMAVAFYDGWEVIATRDASAKELENSGAQHQHRVLYRKKFLADDLSLERLLVLEHYFINHQKAYILTFSVPQPSWNNVKMDFQKMLDDFLIATKNKEV